MKASPTFKRERCRNKQRYGKDHEDFSHPRIPTSRQKRFVMTRDVKKQDERADAHARRHQRR